jgi:hypothetical protein
MLGVLFGSMFGVIDRRQLVTMGEMGMMSGLFMIAGLREARCFAMVLGRVFVVLGGFVMVMMDAVFVHGWISWWIGWT